MIKKIVNYIRDNGFKINFVNNKLNIVNYDEILDVNSNSIRIIKENKTITIYGSDLKLSKLLDKEILICGLIKKIEL